MAGRTIDMVRGVRVVAMSAVCQFRFKEKERVIYTFGMTGVDFQALAFLSKKFSEFSGMRHGGAGSSTPTKKKKTRSESPLRWKDHLDAISMFAPGQPHILVRVTSGLGLAGTGRMEWGNGKIPIIWGDCRFFFLKKMRLPPLRINWNCVCKSQSTATERRLGSYSNRNAATVAELHGTRGFHKGGTGLGSVKEKLIGQTRSRHLGRRVYYHTYPLPRAALLDQSSLE